eukprot:COSAG01_NODE_19970_length_978_cov_47.996587_1_plen_78_part_00
MAYLDDWGGFASALAAGSDLQDLDIPLDAAAPPISDMSHGQHMAWVAYSLFLKLCDDLGLPMQRVLSKTSPFWTVTG